MQIKLILPLVAVVAVAIFFMFANTKPTGNFAISEDPLAVKFAALNSAGTNFCAGPDILNRVKALGAESLQGACCSAMDFHRYTEQVEGLKKYSEISIIPADPYDITVPLAEELLGYQKSIELTAEQQAVYDEAMQMSHEGGPCCCKCWRWYAFEGQAKKLIAEYGFSAEQIAEVWDLEDGCGGAGHAEHGENMERETFEPHAP